jgi:uncharacterized protein YegP (UPF0339 family)
MATAITKSRSTRERPRRAARGPESMEFLIYEDNGGGYHWSIVAGDGATLAWSGSFASYDDAMQAAQRIRQGAASASGVRERPVDLTARRVAKSDNSDAERWLDEGGSFSSEAVAKSLLPR